MYIHHDRRLVLHKDEQRTPTTKKREKNNPRVEFKTMKFPVTHLAKLCKY